MPKLRNVSCMVVAAIMTNALSFSLYAAERVPKKGSIVTGTCLLSTSYLIFAGAGMSVGGAESLAIPVVGPLVQIAKEKPVTPGVVMYSGMFLAEAIGVALITRGIVGNRVEQRVRVLPTISQQGAGVIASVLLQQKL